MARFFVGLFAGVLAGGIAWLFKHDTGLVIFVGLCVALIVWFTRVADEIVDAVIGFGEFIGIL